MTRFVAGERVRHPSLGEGIVQQNDGGNVHVIFDMKDSRGDHVKGIYDPNWFRVHDGWLEKLSSKMRDSQR